VRQCQGRRAHRDMALTQSSTAVIRGPAARVDRSDHDHDQFLSLHARRAIIRRSVTILSQSRKLPTSIM
jgi:hypothetical protein